MNKDKKPSHAIFMALAGALLITLLTSAAQQPTQAFQRRAARAKPRVSAVVYACPMHPEVTSRKPGKCPKCGMALRRRTAAPTATAPTGVAAASDVKTQPRETSAATAAEANSQPPRIPDVTVYDQDNRRLNFYTDLVKGKTVIINFIFTTCTTICPPLTATFRRVQQELGARAGRDVQLISISVDPTVDVPERLKAFSDQFKAGPGWSFVTGGRQDIDQLLKSLGAYVSDKNDHTPMILIGNEPAGFWTRTYGLASAATLVKVVDEAAAHSPVASAIGSGNSNSGMTTAAGAGTGSQSENVKQAKTATPGSPAFQSVAYASVKIMIEAMKLGGRNLDRSSLINSLEQLQDFKTGVLPPVTFGPNRRAGSASSYVVGIDLNKKSYVPVSDRLTPKDKP